MEGLKLEYHQGTDGMLYPNIQLEDTSEITLGKYGLIAMEYLKENHYERYRTMVRFGILKEKMKQIEEEANQLQDQLMKDYLKTHKPKNPSSTMEMWRIREQGMRMAEEIVLHQIVNRYH